MGTWLRLSTIVGVLVIVFMVLPEGNGPVASTRHSSGLDAARALAEATEDLRTTAAIEAQYVMDPRLSALAIEVDTRAGVVTLAGRVDSVSDVAHAIDLAMRHRNVREVISTLEVVQ